MSADARTVGRADMNDTLAGVVSPGRRPEDRRRGPTWISREYLAWRSLLAFGDLLGRDGRPSSTKLAGFSIVMMGHYVAFKTVSVTATILGAWSLGIACLYGYRAFSAWLEFKHKKIDVLSGGEPG